jgi:hypothetical protein
MKIAEIVRAVVLFPERAACIPNITSRYFENAAATIGNINLRRYLKHKEKP